MSDYIVIQSTQAPYSSSFAIDAFEAALAASNLGIVVKFMFIDDGVYQLSAAQTPEHIKHKSMLKKLSALPLFDVEDLMVMDTHIQARNLSIESLGVPVRVINKEAFLRLCKQAQQVLVF